MSAGIFETRADIDHTDVEGVGGLLLPADFEFGALLAFQAREIGDCP